jgi:Gpi18-like mannosyltransferase
MRKKDFLFVLFSFLVWRVALFVFLLIASKTFPLQLNFLGGEKANYLANPWLWSWLNFDGVHYLAIAEVGYQSLTYFYFPVFPFVTRFFGNLIGGGQINYAIFGLIVSNVSFFIALLGLWKLIVKEFDSKVAKLTILLMLFSPTSFYFGSYYTESLFLALTVWSFYFLRHGKSVYGGVLGAISTAVRIIGVALAPAFFIEFLQDKRKNFLTLVNIVLIPTGIGVYIYYLYTKTGDPFNFLSTVSIFGAQRSSSFIFLPQVFYRYFFKIIPSVSYSYFPNVFTTYLELFAGILFLGLSILSFWKLKAGYATYLSLGYLIPTLSGSFSSLPRYVLVLFPAFILMAMYIKSWPKVWKVLLFGVLFIGLGLATSLFARGYWIS